MNVISLFLGVTLTVAALPSVAACKTPARYLWFNQPAERLTESCVLGSGRLGAMVFGCVEDERVILNEEGMWSGSPQEADREQASEALLEIRRLLLAGRNADAEQLVNRHFTCAGAGSGLGKGKSLPYGSYQVLGDLRVKVHHSIDGSTHDYRRELSLSDATARVTYGKGDVTYLREAFSSAVDHAIVYRFSADKPGAVMLDAGLERPERSSLVVHGEDTLEMHGQLEDGSNGADGVRYSAMLRAIAPSGTVSVRNGKIRVRDADEVLLLVAAATDIGSFAGRQVENPRQTAAHDLRRASARPYDELAKRHKKDHRRLYDRVSLQVSDRSGYQAPDVPTPARIEAADPADADLVCLLFDYGRYLLIGSSRAGGFPANLQGIWADTLQTPWNADWHANVNVQMNYWPAGPCGLSELQEPLVALIDSLVEPGQQTAKMYYNARGWVAHVLINPWGFTSPGESASWGSTPTCSAWLCQHLWDHYLFTRDRVYLQEVYPTLRGASEFYVDMLIEEPIHGWLVTAPSNSPENAFIDEQGRQVHTCMGPAGDQQMLRYLFDSVIRASRILGQDAEYAKRLQTIRDRLAPTQIGADGRLLEWLREREEADPHHRHVSHLWGLYPGFEIDRHATPELAAAARKSLEARGDGGTGWGIANKACLWARLGDGDRALTLLRRLLRPIGAEGLKIRWQGGVYPNLLDGHPPFQIDGNFGATAAVAEMLLQSRFDDPDNKEPPEIDLLPALPSAWASGEVHGLVARGAVTVDIWWDRGVLKKAALRGAYQGDAIIRYGDLCERVKLDAGRQVVLGPKLETVEKKSPLGSS